ncbi:MAG: hypothetical protein ABSB74_06250 [Tepidisphaeraceae bacterium]
MIVERDADKPECCSNCGEKIGKLETAHIWNQRVVCGRCIGKLRPQGADDVAGQMPKLVKPMGRFIAGWILIVSALGLFWAGWFTADKANAAADTILSEESSIRSSDYWDARINALADTTDLGREAQQDASISKLQADLADMNVRAMEARLEYVPWIRAFYISGIVVGLMGLIFIVWWIGSPSVVRGGLC